MVNATLGELQAASIDFVLVWMSSKPDFEILGVIADATRMWRGVDWGVQWDRALENANK
jgi:hypothetical protein